MSDIPPNYIPDNQPPHEPRPEKDYSRKPRGPRSPILAGLLSIIPGLGHIYAGQTARGIGYLLLAVTMGLLIYWTNVTTEFRAFPALIPMLIVFSVLFWLWTILSAIRAADNKRFVPAIGVIAVLLFTYLLGWQVIELNMEKFFTEFSDTFNIFTRVIWPWEAAVIFPEDVIVVDNDFLNPCPTDGTELPTQTPSSGDEAWITVDPPCGEFTQYVIEDGKGVNKPGTSIRVQGGGFDPNKEVEIWWEDPIGNEFRPQTPDGTVVVTTDENGAFDVTFDAPQYSVITEGTQLHHVQVRQVAAVGAAQINPDLVAAIDRMIVTIFQALMATTFGIILAIPFSFLAAHNLDGVRRSMVIGIALLGLLGVPVFLLLRLLLGSVLSRVLDPTAALFILLSITAILIGGALFLWRALFPQGYEVGMQALSRFALLVLVLGIVYGLLALLGTAFSWTRETFHISTLTPVVSGLRAVTQAALIAITATGVLVTVSFLTWKVAKPDVLASTAGWFARFTDGLEAPLASALYYSVRFILNVTRSIEPIIWAVIAAVWVGLGPAAGVLALMIHTIASLGKLYSEAIESIDPGPVEALTATGANRLQTIIYAMIPQVIPPFLSFTVYRWDINVRMSTIIGVVGGGGIGQLLFQWIRQTAWSEAGMAVWLIAITVSLMDYASTELRKRFV